MATRSDGSDTPDSTAETDCRDTLAMLASCSWESPCARRASRNRAPDPAASASLTAPSSPPPPGSRSVLAQVM
jgi:hypothetical protein